MEIKVLGSAAGGGFPQWNCACRNCMGVRTGSVRAKPRTQTQLAVSLSPSDWILVGASPDLRGQILSEPSLNPAKATNQSPVAGVLLTSADVDSVAGLLHLREFQPLQIYATQSVRRVLTEDNHIFCALNRANPPAVWHDIRINEWFPLPGVHSAGSETGLCCCAISAGGSFPDYVSERLLESLAPEEAVIGLTFSQADKKLLFAPSISGHSSEWKEHARSSDLCLIDGTFWTDDELISAGRGSRTAREIGHVPLSGPQGLLEDFGPAACQRILVHINNTNPILDEDSPEFHEVLRKGWQIAYDGMEIHL